MNNMNTNRNHTTMKIFPYIYIAFITLNVLAPIRCTVEAFTVQLQHRHLSKQQQHVVVNSNENASVHINSNVNVNRNHLHFCRTPTRLQTKVNQAFNDNMENSSSSSSFSSELSSTSSSYDMPWSSNQEWALQDKISKYMINIPTLNNPTLKGGGINKTTFALWYTMRKEVTEVMGYEIEYLQSKYAALAMNINDKDNANANVNANSNDIKSATPPGILPFIDDFEFRKNGGMKGRVYGLVGIEPATEIVTSPLKDVELTLPKGFVLTEDGSCAYELGIPKSERKLNVNTNDAYSMNLSALSEDSATALVSDVSEQGSRLASNVVKELGDPETSRMIVNLGATTAILLGTATAINMLSHHLTVNVFWV